MRENQKLSDPPQTTHAGAFTGFYSPGVQDEEETVRTPSMSNHERVLLGGYSCVLGDSPRPGGVSQEPGKILSEEPGKKTLEQTRMQDIMAETVDSIGKNGENVQSPVGMCVRGGRAGVGATDFFKKAGRWTGNW